MEGWHTGYLRRMEEKRAICHRGNDRVGVADLRGWSSAITPWRLFWIATLSGDLPPSSTVLGSTSSRVSSIFTTPSCPLKAAHQSGVRPAVLGWSGLTSSRSSSIFTTPSCPLQAAPQSGVWPNLSGLSGLTSSRPSSIFTTPSCPFPAARQSGVLLLLSDLSG